MPNAMDLLRPEVRAYSHKGYELEYDLYHLQRSQEVSIRDATVFYAARILEALSAAALETMGLKGKENAFSNLTRLEEYGLLPPHTLYWAHALRRTGNAVRHAKSRTAPQEAETSVAFLEYWLRWFFCVFPYGARLDDLTMEAGGGLFIRDADLSRILGMIEANDPAPGRVAQQVMEGSYEKIKHAPAVLAVLAERLLRTNRLAEARGFLDWSAGLHGEDLRLLQLRGLCHSRMGLLDEAIEILEPSYKRYRTDDEMIGIMAGVYKRKWRASPAETLWLERSHKAYESGWKQDAENAYLGVNVATTGLFLGRRDEAESVAARVREVLLARAEVLAGLREGPRLSLSLWDRLSLVEAELLLGNFEAAVREFSQARQSRPDATGSLAVARQQFMEIAKRIDAPDDMFPDVAKA